MQYTINQLYEHLLEKVNSVYSIFKDFFGEEHVDLQYSIPENTLKALLRMSVDTYNNENCDKVYEISDSKLEEIKHKIQNYKATIYVWWSNVTVANENDKSIDIYDLYAKIDINFNGMIPYENHGFLLNRATYTKTQFISNYLHSHVVSIPKTDFTQFMSPCLGDGPIKNTILTLKNEYNETWWMLFCLELSMYVTVESLAGVPYKRLEGVGVSSRMYTNDFTSLASIKNTPESIKGYLKDIIRYYLKHGHLSLSYIDSNFKCGMSFYDYIIDVSNAVINYYNKYLSHSIQLDRLYANGFFKRVRVSGGKFWSIDGEYDSDLSSFNGKNVLTFKGKQILTSIIDNPLNDCIYAIVLNAEVALYILKSILQIINFRYKNKYGIKYIFPEDIASSCKRAIYV